jgi:ubiquitin-like domain-containing CTD phosphatase 1
VFDLKAALDKLTMVPPERQKIIGLVKGKLPPDQATMYLFDAYVSSQIIHINHRRELNLVNGKKFTLIGTPQGHEHKDPATLDLPDVFNDLDIDFSADPNSEVVRRFKNDSRNKRKIREAVAALNVNLMNPLREGKRLLVLDLDYSAFSIPFFLRF